MPKHTGRVQSDSTGATPRWFNGRATRPANAPDLAEVQDWINWSNESRQLRVAS